MALIRLTAAPLDGGAALPEALVDQHVKPTAAQAALVSGMRLAALAWVESHTRHSVAKRAFVATYDGFPASIRLPREPVRGVTALRYSADGVTWTDGLASVSVRGDVIVPGVGVAGFATCCLVEVTFTAGYDNLGADAPSLQIAALMLLQHLFDGGSVDDVPATIGMLIDEGYRAPVMAS